MAFVGGDHEPAARNFVAYELGLDILTHRDSMHLWGKEAVARGFELGPILGHRTILQWKAELNTIRCLVSTFTIKVSI
jgi:hypothetical protein